MKISITARHIEVTSGLRQFTEQRLEKLHKFAPDIHGAHVVLRQEKAACQAEVTVRLNGVELVSTQDHPEPGAAVERAVDRLEEQLRRHKEKRLTKTQRGGKYTNGVAPAPDDEPGGEE